MKKEKVKINKLKQVREGEYEGERKRWGEQTGYVLIHPQVMDLHLSNRQHE